MNSRYVNLVGNRMRGFGRFAGPLLLAMCGIALTAAASPSDLAGSGDAPALSEALQWLSVPPRFHALYDFEMTVQVRLLLFWIGKDDVGGGYIKIGQAADDSSLEVIRLLFGSDPAKAHGINRWGAGTEVVRRRSNGAAQASAFLGFMKSSKGESVGAMRQELSKEKREGQHRFEAIISRVDRGHAVSATVPFYLDHDFDLGELEPAEKHLPGCTGTLTLGDTFIDAGLTELVRGRDGLARFWVAGATRKVEVVFGREFTTAICYAPLNGPYVCIEPQTGPTNAFNLKHEGKIPSLRTLAPGKTFQESYWFIPTGY